MGIPGNPADLGSIISLMGEFGRYVLIGENPFNIELMWQRMYAERHDFRHPSLYATPVISAFGDGVVGHSREGDRPTGLQPIGREVS